MFFFNENGKIQEFDDYMKITCCSLCKMPYYQRITEQVPGFREVDEDRCPYCHHVNGRSGDVEYFNTPFTEEEMNEWNGNEGN